MQGNGSKWKSVFAPEILWKMKQEEFFGQGHEGQKDKSGLMAVYF